MRGCSPRNYGGIHLSDSETNIVLSQAGPVTNSPVTDGSSAVPLPVHPVAADLPPPDPLTTAPGDLTHQIADLPQRAIDFMTVGGPAMWAIGVLSVIALALILWKIWRLALIGAWSRSKARDAIALFEAGRPGEAAALVAGRRGLRSRVIHAALRARVTLTGEAAREETTRVARREIARAGSGLRPLELIVTIAPLLGLLGTVLGMIAAFQALQEAGARADPALLAGGIWEALLTTAAGMAVAIPASAALAWFEGVVDAMAADVEDGVTRIFVAERRLPEAAARAAE